MCAKFCAGKSHTLEFCQIGFCCWLVVDQAIFTADRVVNGRPNSAPAIPNGLKFRVVCTYIFSGIDPVVMYVKYQCTVFGKL